MLILNREVDEEIVINEEVVIKVLKVSGNKVRLGIIAPEHIRVRRKEAKDQDD